MKAFSILLALVSFFCAVGVVMSIVSALAFDAMLYCIAATVCGVLHLVIEDSLKDKGLWD